MVTRAAENVKNNIRDPSRSPTFHLGAHVTMPPAVLCLTKEFSLNY
jgi:hypothetical protein